MKVALIFGITGQDGSYLAELLIMKGYKIYGYLVSFKLKIEKIEFEGCLQQIQLL